VTAKPKSAKLSEAHIQQAGDDLLALDGWRKIVTDPPQLRGLGVSEKGIPDRLYMRYKPNPYERHHDREVPGGFGGWDPVVPCQAEALWIEWKRKGGKAALHQKAWHQAERARGALVWVSGEDFPATIEGFEAHYLASGLNRRMSQPRLRVQLGAKHEQ
jgi:hypothetical protein